MITIGIELKIARPAICRELSTALQVANRELAATSPSPFSRATRVSLSPWSYLLFVRGRRNEGVKRELNGRLLTEGEY